MRDTLLLFDVDGTLTIPRQVIEKDMFKYLMEEIKPRFSIGLVGGSDLDKVLEQMGPDFKLDDFDYIFPENGLIAFKNGKEIGRQSIIKYLGEEKSQKLINCCLSYMSKLKLPVKRGTFVEYRTGLINVSPVGRSCSQSERIEFEQYDLKFKIREQFVNFLKQDLPDLDLQYSIGGQISFDIFPVGWDKRYCLRFVEDEYKGKIHFFGDRAYKGGNDYEIFNDSRIQGHSVKCPSDTRKLLDTLLSV